MPSTQGRTGWEIALQSHLSSATVDHRQILSGATTPEEIIAILKRAQQKNKASKVNKLLDVVTRVTAPLRDFQTAVDVLVQANAEIGYANYRVGETQYPNI
jgi:hypothetical protein